MNEREKRDIYDDVIFALAKKEKEDEKKLRARNLEYMLEVFSNISSITYRTLWSEVIFYTIYLSPYLFDIIYMLYCGTLNSWPRLAMFSL